jgi:hypothetical protein
MLYINIFGNIDESFVKSQNCSITVYG